LNEIRLVEVRRLHVDEGQAGAVSVQLVMRDLVDLDIEQADHRNILRPCDAAECDNRRRRPVASQQLAQRQSAADGIRIGIVLQQDMDLLSLAKERANALDFLDVQRVEELRGAKLFEYIGQLQVAEQRIGGFFVAVIVRG